MKLIFKSNKLFKIMNPVGWVSNIPHTINNLNIGLIYKHDLLTNITTTNFIISSSQRHEISDDRFGVNCILKFETHTDILESTKQNIIDFFKQKNLDLILEES